MAIPGPYGIFDTGQMVCAVVRADIDGMQIVARCYGPHAVQDALLRAEFLNQEYRDAEIENAYQQDREACDEYLEPQEVVNNGE